MLNIYFYVQALHLNGRSLTDLPARTRSDRGGENVLVAAMQDFLTNASLTQSNHIFGSSVTNQVRIRKLTIVYCDMKCLNSLQVIEQWWRGFRERHGEFFKSHIHELALTGYYNEQDSTCRLVLTK